MSEGNLKFSAAELNLVIHATEDEGKVLQSIEDILSVPTDCFISSSSEGHFKNEIKLLKGMIPAEQARDLALRIMSLLNRSDREQLSRRLHEYSDEKGNLYLRLDKQRLCQGKVSLSETDSIRIRFKPVKRYKPAGNIESYRGLLSSTE
jgi:RNA binding exosome subunit